MGKLKLGVVFGGLSTEHDISVISGGSVIRNLDKKKYDVFPIYISREGKWFKCSPSEKSFQLGKAFDTQDEIKNICNYLEKLDVIFPVLHGLGGEDGSIQGMFELLNIPYVGTGVLGSSLCMDKIYTKMVFEKANIPHAKYAYIRKYNNKYIFFANDFSEEIFDIYEISKIITQKINFPMFIKPSNSGSSVGISKAKNNNQLIEAIKYAERFDNKILVEEQINGREIECAVLGNEEVEVSCLGEILVAEEFYSFDAKYKNSKSKAVIPSNLSEELTLKVKETAKKAYTATDCKGLARVDFFVDDKNNKIYINEINTLPGFTKISMYTKLWEASGLSYSKLLDKLVELALIREGKKWN